MEKDNDILVNVIVKKTPLNTVYLSQRNNSTDFPVLTCAVSLIDGEARTVIGARPAKAMVVKIKKEYLKVFQKKVRGRKKRQRYLLQHMQQDKLLQIRICVPQKNTELSL